jgi:hypothetical protein
VCFFVVGQNTYLFVTDALMRKFNGSGSSPHGHIRWSDREKLGVPEGSILIFLIYVGDLPVTMKWFKVLFADDAGVIIAHAEVVCFPKFANVRSVNLNKLRIANKLTLNFGETSWNLQRRTRRMLWVVGYDSKLV